MIQSSTLQTTALTLGAASVLPWSAAAQRPAAIRIGMTAVVKDGGDSWFIIYAETITAVGTEAASLETVH